MFSQGKDILEKTNIQTDAVVVNQCDFNNEEMYNFINSKGVECSCLIINTTERGLSRSRNMAIKNAWGDICLICDDDEHLDDDYSEKILNAYNEMSNASMITFIVDYKNKIFSPYPQKLGVIGICKSFSVQITFNRLDIINKNIYFDEKMGSGTGNGAGEENKFMMDCRRKKLNLYYYPAHIGKVLSANSMWNHGFTVKYFRDRGWSMRRSFGFIYGYLFLLYNYLNHRKAYAKDGLTSGSILRNMHIGFFERRN
jgi:glycosyltransferase involved in cell wall biosynthesis